MKILRAYLDNYGCESCVPGSSYMSLACGVLLQARYIQGSFFYSLLFFSLLFRMVLVVHAHKGLVQNGRPNLKLFKQLFWVITCAWLAMTQTIFLSYHFSTCSFK